MIFLIGESFEDDSVALWHYVMADFPTQRWTTELHNYLKEQILMYPPLPRGRKFMVSKLNVPVRTHLNSHFSWIYSCLNMKYNQKVNLASISIQYSCSLQ